MPKKPRDYQAEYRRRILKGTQRGLTIQQARGMHKKEPIVKRSRPGKVSRKIFTGKWETGVKHRQGKPDEKRSDIRVYRLLPHENAEPARTARRITDNAWRNWGATKTKKSRIFAVWFLVHNLPYGDGQLNYAWDNGDHPKRNNTNYWGGRVTGKQDLYERIFGSLREDEPEEGRRTVLILLQIKEFQRYE